MSAVLDLSAPDLWVVEQNGPVVIQLGGTFDGVTIPWGTQACVDGSVVRVVLGKLPGPKAQSVGKAWYEAIVMRVRATLTIARAEPMRLSGYPFEEL